MYLSLRITFFKKTERVLLLLSVKLKNYKFSLVWFDWSYIYV